MSDGATGVDVGADADTYAWRRRRDLEGGKELGIWLLSDGEDVAAELYVESHEYRGGNFDVYTYTDADDWVHEGSFESVVAAFGAAEDVLGASGYGVVDAGSPAGRGRD